MDLSKKDKLELPFKDILGDLDDKDDTTRTEMCNKFTNILRALDSDKFSCVYAANIDSECIDAYPKDHSRPFYQYDLVGDWQSRYPDREGPNHPFHYAGSYGSIFALHSEDVRQAH